MINRWSGYTAGSWLFFAGKLEHRTERQELTIEVGLGNCGAHIDQSLSPG